LAGTGKHFSAKFVLIIDEDFEYALIFEKKEIFLFL